jgi:hypothetical protein
MVNKHSLVFRMPNIISHTLISNEFYFNYRWGQFYNYKIIEFYFLGY